MALFQEFDTYRDCQKTADISQCGAYRWWLRRSYQHGGDGRVVCFIGLNPSTADHEIDDPTIKRCLGFVRHWGCSVLHMLNLFAFRATEPKDLLGATEPIGSQNDMHLLGAGTADIVVAAWGAWLPKTHPTRDSEVAAILKGSPLKCLGLTKNGGPRHPLYVSANQQLVDFQCKPFA